MPRDDKEVIAAKMRSLVENHDFQSVFNSLRDTYIADIERATLDGSPEADRKALECVRRLHALLDLKREVVRPILSASRKENLNNVQK